MVDRGVDIFRKPVTSLKEILHQSGTNSHVLMYILFFPHQYWSLISHVLCANALLSFKRLMALERARAQARV
jgi:hypothetical protein